MNFKRVLPVLLLGVMSAAMAQLEPDDPDWKEGDIPPPPAFSVDKLVPFDGGTASSTLSYGVDPATLSIGKTDGIVRYVMVASSTSGAQNVVYEGVRCSSGEVKTYARYSNSKWTALPNPEWRSVFGGAPTRYVVRLARAGLCDNAAPPASPDEIVRKLKLGEYYRAK